MGQCGLHGSPEGCGSGGSEHSPVNRHAGVYCSTMGCQTGTEMDHGRTGSLGSGVLVTWSGTTGFSRETDTIRVYKYTYSY